MSKDRECAPWHIDLFKKHRHARIRTTTYTHSEVRRERRKRRVEARSIYSLKSSLPHWSHLFHRGYISCAGLNLAAMWQVPLCSNTGVFRGSQGLNHHSYTPHEPRSSSEKTCETRWRDFWFPAVFFSSSSRKVIITQSITICYTIFVSALYKEAVTNSFQPQHIIYLPWVFFFPTGLFLIGWSMILKFSIFLHQWQHLSISSRSKS